MAEEEAGLVSISGGKPLPSKEHQIQLVTEAVAVVLDVSGGDKRFTSVPVIHQESKAYRAQPPCNVRRSTSLMLMTYSSLISSKETMCFSFVSA